MMRTSSHKRVVVSSVACNKLRARQSLLHVTYLPFLGKCSESFVNPLHAPMLTTVNPVVLHRYQRLPIAACAAAVPWALAMTIAGIAYKEALGYPYFFFK